MNRATAASPDVGGQRYQHKAEASGVAKQRRYSLRPIVGDQVTGPDHGADRANSEAQDQKPQREFANLPAVSKRPEFAAPSFLQRNR